MHKIRKQYSLHFSDKKFIASFIVSILMLVIALFINFYAGVYATERASNSITDIILSNTRVFDVDGIFVYGAFFLWIFIIGVTVARPKQIPFTIKTLSLFIVIRSIFISLTHLGPFPTQVLLSDTNIINTFMNKFSFGADLFFSGHTGIPFLMALIFRDNPYLRVIFVASSILFAVVVLLGHLHYSIDVFSAFFITYTIFHLATIFFKKDLKLFNEGVVKS